MKMTRSRGLNIEAGCVSRKLPDPAAPMSLVASSPPGQGDGPELCGTAVGRARGYRWPGVRRRTELARSGGGCD